MVIPSGFRLTSPPECASPVAFLYFLRCPVSDDVRYVGSARDPIGRYRSHVGDCQKLVNRSQIKDGWFSSWNVFEKGTEKEKWIAGLLESSTLPVLEVVACVPKEFVVDAESQLYDSCVAYGYKLLNAVRPNASNKNTGCLSGVAS